MIRHSHINHSQRRHIDLSGWEQGGGGGNQGGACPLHKALVLGQPPPQVALHSGLQQSSGPGGPHQGFDSSGWTPTPPQGLSVTFDKQHLTKHDKPCVCSVHLLMPTNGKRSGIIF